MNTRKFILLLSSLFLLSFSAISQNSEQQVVMDSLLKSAKQEFSAGRYEKSLEIYNLLYQLSVTLTDTLGMLEALSATISCCHGLSDMETAIRNSEKFIRLAMASDDVGYLEIALAQYVHTQNQIIEKDLPTAMPLTDSTYKEFALFRILEVSQYTPDSIVITVAGGKYDGIDTTEAAFCYGIKHESEGIDREVHLVANAKYLNSSCNRSWYLLSEVDLSNPVEKIYPGDLLSVKAYQSYSTERSLLQKFANYTVQFTTSSNSNLLHRRLFSSLSPDSLLMGFLKILLHKVIETAEFVNDDPDFTGINISGGFFAGKNLVEGMLSSQPRHIEGFLSYLAYFPAKYIGQEFYFPDIYGTWLINDSPLESKSLLEFLLKADDPAPILVAYRDSIRANETLELWRIEGQRSINHLDYVTAEKIIKIITIYSKLFSAPESRAHGYLLQGRLWDRKEVVDSARYYYTLANAIFTTEGDELYGNQCRNALLFKQKNSLAKVRVQSGHMLWPTQIKMSPDGTLLASGGINGEVKIWHLQTGRELETLTGHFSEINCVDWSPDGMLFLSADDDGVIIVRNTIDFSEKYKMNVGKSVSAAKFSPDSKIIASCGLDSLVRIWDAKSGTQVRSLQRHCSYVYDVTFSTKSGYLFSCGRDSMIYEWDYTYGDMTHWYKESSIVTSITMVPDGSYFIAATVDSLLSFWHYSDHKEWGTIPNAVERFAGSIYVSRPAVSPDSRFAVRATLTNKLSILDLHNNQAVKINSGHDGIITSLDFSKDGKYLITIAHDMEPSIRIWDMQQWDFGSTKKLYSRDISFFSDPVAKSAFIQNGEILLLQSQLFLQTFDLRTGQSRSFGEDFTNGAFSILSDLTDTAFRYAYVLDPYYDNQLKVMDTRDEMKLVRAFPFDSLSVDGIAVYDVSPSLEFACVATQKGRIRVYDRNSSVYAEFRFPNVSGSNTEVIGINIDNTQKTLVYATNDGRMDLRTLSGSFIDSLQLPGNAYFSCMKADRSTGRIYMGTSTGIIKVYDQVKQQFLKDITISGTHEIYALAVTKDERFIAIASGENKIFLIHLPTNEVKWKIEKFSGFVNNMTISPDDSILSISSQDNKVALVKLHSKEPMVDLYTIKRRDIVAISHDNYYLASKASLAGIHYTYNNKVYPFEQFDCKYNRPDIVLARLGKADAKIIQSYSNAYQKRLKKLGIDEQMLEESFELPEVRILNKNILPLSTSSNTIAIHFQAVDKQHAITKVQVWVNDVPMFGRKGYLPDHISNLSDFRDIVRVVLGNGLNKIQIAVTNEVGVESIKEIILVNHTTSEVHKPSLYFIGIGVGKYTDEKMNLTYAAKDISDMAAMFYENKGGIYGFVYIDTVTNYSATLENIRELKTRLMSSTVSDRVIIMYSGHGVLSSSLDYFLATTDMNFYVPEERGLSYNELEDLLDGIPARDKLLLIDACHSGEVDKENVEWTIADNIEIGIVTFKSFATNNKQMMLGLDNSFELMKELFSDVSLGTGAYVISSSSGVEFSLEGRDWKNGVFTYAMKESLLERKGDGNQDGKITVQELNEYVSSRVSTLTNGQQTPTMRKEKLEFDFRVW